MTLTRLHITARLVAIIMAVISVATTKAQEIYRVESAPAAVQLRTNGLFDLALCPNIGLEIQTDLGVAWQLDYTGAWWNNDEKHRYFSNYAFQTELRYYLDSRESEFPYAGHHVGVYGQMATFDFEFGEKGYQARDLDRAFGIGASYGYVFRLSRHWSLDLTMGVGYFVGKYDTYVPMEDGYKREETRRKAFFGPTKLEATLVWNLNVKNNK